MKIATWNVNGLKARLDFVLLWLRARQPDVVGLQELKLTDDTFPHEAFTAEGYEAVVHGQKAWNGVAVLARQPLDLLQCGLPGAEDSGARLITARVTAGPSGGPLSFTTIYCPNGKHLQHPDYAMKLRWFDLLHQYWGQQPDDEAAILCGDFNVVPAAIDGWNPDAEGQIFYTADERRRFRALLDCGLHDLFRERHPDQQVFSWWDYRGGAFHRGQGLRIDFLLATRSVQDHLSDVSIDRDYRKKQDGMTASDHAPVIAELR